MRERKIFDEMHEDITSIYKRVNAQEYSEQTLYYNKKYRQMNATDQYAREKELNSINFESPALFFSLLLIALDMDLFGLYLLTANAYVFCLPFVS